MELARRNNLKTHGIVGDYKYLPPRNLKLDKRRHKPEIEPISRPFIVPQRFCMGSGEFS